MDPLRRCEFVRKVERLSVRVLDRIDTRPPLASEFRSVKLEVFLNRKRNSLHQQRHFQPLGKDTTLGNSDVELLQDSPLRGDGQPLKSAGREIDLGVILSDGRELRARQASADAPQYLVANVSGVRVWLVRVELLCANAGRQAMSATGVHLHRQPLHNLRVCACRCGAVWPDQVGLEKHIGASADAHGYNYGFHRFVELSHARHYRSCPRHWTRYICVIVKLAVVDDVFGWNPHRVFRVVCAEIDRRHRSPLTARCLGEPVGDRNRSRVALVVFDAVADRVFILLVVSVEVVITPLRIDVLNLKAERLIS